MLEHYQLFLSGLPAGLVDYDARNRDDEIEQSPAKFLDAIGHIVTELRTFDHASLKTALTLRALAAPKGGHVEVASTIGRELVFLSSHTIHHVAIVKLMAHSMGISLPEEYGIAYSTSEHRAASCRPAETSRCAP